MWWTSWLGRSKISIEMITWLLRAGSIICQWVLLTFLFKDRHSFIAPSYEIRLWLCVALLCLISLSLSKKSLFFASAGFASISLFLFIVGSFWFGFR
jgi:hypothetical protein